MDEERLTIMPQESGYSQSHACPVTGPIPQSDLLTPNMHRLKDKYGFDTVAARRTCVKLACVPTGSHVLDVGTSSGWMAIVLASATHQVAAIDVDAFALSRARLLAKQFGDEVADRIDFLQGDALAIPFKDDSFDGVFSFESLHHFSDCERAVEEMYRVCRPGGVVTIADLNVDGLNAVREAMQELTGQPHEANPCRLDALQQLLLQFGHVERHETPFLGVFMLRKGFTSVVHQSQTAGSKILQKQPSPTCQIYKPA